MINYFSDTTMANPITWQERFLIISFIGFLLLITVGCSWKSDIVRDDRFRSASGEANPDTSAQESCIIVSITRLMEKSNPTIKLTSDGKIVRWDGASLKLSRVGIGSLTPAETEKLFTLFDSLSLVQAMGEGIQEGDIFMITGCRNQRVGRFIEPLAPASAAQLVSRMLQFSASVAFSKNTEYFMRSEPIDSARQKGLRESRVEIHSIDEFSSKDQQLLLNAASLPFEFKLISASAFERILNKTGSPEFILIFAKNSWASISLWKPQ